MKKYLLILISLSIGLTAFTQEAKISFSKSTHDFGTIKEEDGVKTYQFEFKNTGSSPLIIKNVKASCGCTTPEWTKAPIGSGKTGFIKVSFDPINRPGPFNKSITINSNTNPPENTLHIKGIVKERTKTIDDKYKYSINGLMLKSNHLALTKIPNTGSKDEAIVLYNSTNKPMVVEFYQIPKHITFEKTKVKIAPKSKSYVEITYDASKKGDWGFVTDRILITVNHERNPKNKLTISADIHEDFSSLSPSELAKAPKINIEKKIFDFGEIKRGVKKTYKVKITNEGQSTLKIHKIKSSCGCTVSEIDSREIEAGASTYINISFNSKNQSGKQHKTITLITNDPKNSKIILRVKGTVLE